MMNNEELINHFKNIISGSVTKKENDEFMQTIMQIAKTDYTNRKLNPVCEALDNLDDFLEELDEFYGLAALKYGDEAYDALEILRSWYYEQNKKDEIIYYLLDMLEEEHVGMKAAAIKEIADKFDIEF